MSTYSNARAFRALVRASLQAILKSPSAIVFGILFPLIFILVFGFLGGDGGFSTVRIAVTPESDTVGPVYQGLRQVPLVRISPRKTEKEVKQDLSKGRIAAIVSIRETPGDTPASHVTIQGAESEMPRVKQLEGIIADVIQSTDPYIHQRTAALGKIETKFSSVREFKTIDFILPGQLGFSLMAGSIFGTAFVFFSLRQTLVLKRFFATPVRREVIVVAEGIARMLFQLLTAIVIILIGKYAFGYTLVKGFSTFLAMMGLSALGVFVFMGFGFIISGLAKNESSIPPFANLITLPQFLLAGTFFSVEAFPKWLQPVSKALPLTYLNDAMRKVAFEGAGFGAIKWEVLIMAVWGVVLYAVAARVFRWE